KHLSVADLARAGGTDDGRDRGLTAVVGNDELDFDLGQKIHGVFAAAKDFNVAFLTAEALDFHNGHAFDANLAEGILNFLQFEWFDDRFDFFHKLPSARAGQSSRSGPFR